LGGWEIGFAEDAGSRSDVKQTDAIILPQGRQPVKVLDGVFPSEWCATFIKKHEDIGFTLQHELDLLTENGKCFWYWKKQQ
jgi:hypothetical protein